MFTHLVASGVVFAGLYLSAALPFDGTALSNVLGDEPAPEDLRTDLAQRTESQEFEFPEVESRRPDHVSPEFAVGDVFGEDSALTSAYPGMDLPDAEDGKGYVRTDEFIYLVDSETMIIEVIVYIGDVILR